MSASDQIRKPGNEAESFELDNASTAEALTHNEDASTAGESEISIADIVALLNDRLEALAYDLLGEPNKARSSKRELRYGKKGSLAIAIDGEKIGYW
jgi:hypothetical protein